VRSLGATACTYCQPYDDGLPIVVARRPRVPLRELWTRWKHFE